VRAAIGERPESVEPAFDALTKGCNDCHQATNFGCNVVQRPTSNPYRIRFLRGRSEQWQGKLARDV
jgi:hypothetical protein